MHGTIHLTRIPTMDFLN